MSALLRYLNWYSIQQKILITTRRLVSGSALCFMSVVFAAFATGFGGFAAFGALSDQIGPHPAGAATAVIFLLLAAAAWAAALRFFSVRKSVVNKSVANRKFVGMPPLREHQPAPTIVSLAEAVSSRFIRNAPSLTIMSLAGGFIAGAILFSQKSVMRRQPLK